MGQLCLAHGGVYQKLHAESSDSLLIHHSLLLPLVVMINSTGTGFPTTSMGCSTGAGAFLPAARQGAGLSGIVPLSHYVLLHGEKFVWKS